VSQVTPTTSSTSSATSGATTTAVGSLPDAATGSHRSDRFRADISDLKIKDPRAARGTLMARLGGTAMALGILLGIIGYFMSHTTTNALQQRDAITLAVLGVSVSVVGGVVFLRYSLAGFMRLWLARLILHQDGEDRAA
jgi:hypothetical protein